MDKMRNDQERASGAGARDVTREGSSPEGRASAGPSAEGIEPGAEGTRPKESEREAPSVQVVEPYDDENDGLPSWQGSSEAVADGGATALQRFIDANEPADLEGAREFRQGLLAVLREASALPAAQQPAARAPEIQAEVWKATTILNRRHMGLIRAAVNLIAECHEQLKTKDSPHCYAIPYGAVNALHNALTADADAQQPAVEPVAWLNKKYGTFHTHDPADDVLTAAADAGELIPLYASPTAQPGGKL